MPNLVNPYRFGFSPVQIPGLQLWLDAADTGTISHTGGSVSQWDDKSGNGNHVSQSTPASRPTTGTRTINGLNVIDFDGVSEFLERNDALGFTGNPSIELFMVVKRDTDIEVADVYFGLGSATNSTAGRIIGFAGGTDGYSYRFNNGNEIFNATDGNNNILLYKRSSGDTYTDGEFFLNGVSQSQTSAANPTNTPNLLNQKTLIGAFLNPVASLSNYTDGVIGEVLVYGALNNTQRNGAGNYLSNKWGITWTDI